MVKSRISVDNSSFSRVTQNLQVTDHEDSRFTENKNTPRPSIKQEVSLCFCSSIQKSPNSFKLYSVSRDFNKKFHALTFCGFNRHVWIIDIRDKKNPGFGINYKLHAGKSYTSNEFKSPETDLFFHLFFCCLRKYLLIFTEEKMSSAKQQFKL